MGINPPPAPGIHGAGNPGRFLTELLGKLVVQGFKLAALRNKFVKFYKSRLNIWGKYGNDIYDEFIKMFQSPNIIL